MQRVARARVTVDGPRHAARSARACSCCSGDARRTARREARLAGARSVAGLRFFADAAGLMNLDVRETGGARAGGAAVHALRRDAARAPAGLHAARRRPSEAEPLFERFCALLAAQGVPVAARRLRRAHGGGAGERRTGDAAGRDAGGGRGAGGADERAAARARARSSTRAAGPSCWPRPRRGASRCCARWGSTSRWRTRARTATGRAGPSRATACGRWRSTRRGGWRRGGPEALVIGADTVVVARGVRLGKPADEAEALAMLRRLQGRTHEVWTGLAVVRGRRAAHGRRGHEGAVRAARRTPSCAAYVAHRRAARQGRGLRHPGPGRPVRRGASRATTATSSGCRWPGCASC